MECPDLAQQCAEQIEKELDDHTVGCTVTYDGADYQRLVDRGWKRSKDIIIRKTYKAGASAIMSPALRFCENVILLFVFADKDFNS